jgi:cytochrome c oxidase subunit II
MTGKPAGPRQDGRASLSTRRGFIAAASLGAVSLYGLWAGLGAAPLRFWDLGGADMSDMEMSSGGHGSTGGLSPEEFRRMAEEFNDKHRQADGSVSVTPAEDGQSVTGMEMPTEPDNAALPMPGMDMSETAGHAGHQMPSVTEMEQAASHDSEVLPLEVYVLALQWSFDPSLLRLKANQPYRFRMMAVDAAHGASIQLGSASHIIRLPKGALVERELSFTEPGEYLLYCTIYCGEGHQFMSAKIIVA